MTFSAAVAQQDMGMHTETMRMTTGRCQVLLLTHAHGHRHTLPCTKHAMKHCWVALLCNGRKRQNREEKLQVSGLDQVQSSDAYLLLYVCTAHEISAAEGMQLSRECVIEGKKMSWRGGRGQRRELRRLGQRKRH